MLAATAHAQSSQGCLSANFTGVIPSGTTVTITTPTGQFLAGQTVTVTLVDGGGGSYRVTSPNGSVVLLQPGGGTVSASFTVSPAVVGNVVIRVTVQADTDAAVSISCRDGGGATNALVAAANGLSVILQSSDAIKLGVMDSFTGTTLTPNPDVAHVARLRDDARALALELGDLGPGDPARPALEAELLLARRNLFLARGALLPLEPAAEQASLPRRGMRLDMASLARTADACLEEGCAPPPPGPSSWNAWADGRGIAMNDSLARSNGAGFVGLAGVDYKAVPWLAIGLALGAESFNTNLGNRDLRITSQGFSVVPYLGIRFDANLYAMMFAGASRLTYLTTPVAAGGTTRFDAWRFMAGAALIGLWREGPWRLQPSLDLGFGAENQNAHLAGNGAMVDAQTVHYGRISAGPEMGYRFTLDEWSIEPFVLARANLDLLPDTAVAFLSQQVPIRGQGSGSAGAGVILYSSGFNVRIDVSYDSIGVRGLDVWTGRVRGGWTF